ncbi:MAG: YitT family protein [Pseudobutyrivibrio sp.]|uniref:YitT family protein n=1 Tax=Pseudobutyrivibrio ruminis TaxID=46206 RepID=A0A927UA11_9FIRM|nr:YitT family protein [Pseudobutyrivibrio ruminis]MBQ3773223.1 YitT family protein [Pseudobutyrivibrio sp.]
MKKTQGILQYIFIIVGAIMASFSVALIILPNDAIDYGTAGVAIIISKLTGLSLAPLVFLVFIPFIIAGYVVLGKSFTIKATLGSLTYTLGIHFFEEIPFELNTEHFLAVAFGGAILGAGLSLILRNGGCIDGSEILANIVVKRLSDKTGRNYSMTPVLLAFNALVYFTVFFTIDMTAALLSLLVYVVATTVIDHYTDHFEAIKQVTIITQDPDNIIKDIKEKLNKTCTIMDSRGAIAGENNTLICYISYFELPIMKDIISNHSGSFSTVSTIDEILR